MYWSALCCYTGRLAPLTRRFCHFFGDLSIDGAVKNTTVQIAVVASQAPVVSVVGGSNPEMAAFFPFLSEKYTLGQKRTNRGILSKRVNTIYQSLLGFREGAWGVWNNSKKTGGVLSVAELNPTPQKIHVKKRAIFRQTHFHAGLTITHEQGRVALGCSGGECRGTCIGARCAVIPGVWRL